VGGMEMRLGMELGQPPAAKGRCPLETRMGPVADRLDLFI